MSLYRHVASKDELLQLMWNASAQGAESLELTGEGWRERLRGWAVIQWEMLGRHPWITQMPMAAPPMAPNSLTFVERGLQALDDTGLSDADKLRVIGVISTYTLSEARMAHDAARALEQAGEGGDGIPVSARRGRLRPCCANSSTPRRIRVCTASPGPARSVTRRPDLTRRRNSGLDSSGSSTASRLSSPAAVSHESGTPISAGAALTP